MNLRIGTGPLLAVIAAAVALYAVFFRVPYEQTA